MGNNSSIPTSLMNLPIMPIRSFQWHLNWMKSSNDSVIPSPVRIRPWSSVNFLLFRQEFNRFSLLVRYWRSLLSPHRHLRSLEDQSYPHQKTFKPPHFLNLNWALWIRKIHHQNETTLHEDPQKRSPQRNSPNYDRSDHRVVWKIAWKHNQ